MTVLYFHGFASSPNSQKIESLRALLEPLGVELNTPDLNVPSFEKLDFDAMVERAIGALIPSEARDPLRKRAGDPSPSSRLRMTDAIVGSSLGSVVALEIVRRGIAAPLVL